MHVGAQLVRERERGRDRDSVRESQRARHSEQIGPKAFCPKCLSVLSLSLRFLSLSLH